MNLSEAMEALNIRTSIEYDYDPSGEREAHFPSASHYEVVFSRKSHYNFNNPPTPYYKTFTTHFSVGSGWKREPTPLEVMRSVLQEANDAHIYSSFEEWADNVGYDSDSRKAERIWDAINKSTDELSEFLHDHTGSGSHLDKWLEDPEIMDEELDDNPPIS